MSQPGQYGQQPDPYHGAQGPMSGWSGAVPPPVPAAPPQEVNTSFWLWIADVVIGLVGAVLAFSRVGGITQQAIDAGGGGSPQARELASTIVTAGIVAGAIFGIVIVALQLLFAVFMRRGRNWARIVLTVFGAIGVISALAGLAVGGSTTVNGQIIQTGSPVATVLSLVQAILIVVAIVLFFRPRANEYFAAMRRRV